MPRNEQRLAEFRLIPAQVFCVQAVAVFCGKSCDALLSKVFSQEICANKAGDLVKK